jgi:hypothetical protein
MSRVATHCENTKQRKQNTKYNYTIRKKHVCIKESLKCYVENMFFLKCKADNSTSKKCYYKIGSL